MNSRNRIKTPLAVAVLAAAALPGLAAAATVGYYEACDGAGRANQATAITAAGHTPVNVTLPDAAGLAGLDVFFVDNCSNGGVGAEYLANMPAISNAVAGGMVLMVHDRWVTGAASMVPGSGGVVFTRDVDIEDSDINFPLGSPITTGPGGILTNTSLDGGNSSSHGFVTLASLPPGGTALALRPTAGNGVTVTWGHGSGRVVYSTIPLDFYLAGSGSVPAFAAVYAPNVINWAAGGSFVSCLAEGFKGEKLKLCQLICEVPQPQPVIDKWIRLWLIKIGTAPPCAGGGSIPTSLVSPVPAAATAQPAQGSARGTTNSTR